MLKRDESLIIQAGESGYTSIIIYTYIYVYFNNVNMS